MKFIFVKILLLVFIFGLLGVSCKRNIFPDNVKAALEVSGDNKSELLKVIDFYSHKPEDSLKLKAAFYLIENMPYHSFISEDTFYSEVFDEANKYRERFVTREKHITNVKLSIKVNSRLKELMDSLDRKKTVGRRGLERYRDVNYLSSEYLIKNIDLSFKAYEENPLKLCENFEEFLHFVLPYRTIGDPIEFSKREDLYLKYRWVFDSLKVNSLEKIVKDISKELSFKAVELKHDNYRGFYTSKQIEKIKIASCLELSSYMVNLLRAIGVPSGVDYIRKWGDEHNSVNHSWIFCKTNKKGFEAINPGVFMNLNGMYKFSSIPKIFRQTFHPTKKADNDVTRMYRRTYDVEIKNMFLDDVEKNETYLGIYDSFKGFFEVIKAKKEVDQKFLFSDMGNNIVYFPFSNINNICQPINYPFELTKSGEVILFKGSKDVYEKVTLLRKYPPFSLRRKKTKQRRIQSINGLILQGANIDNDAFYTDLYVTSGLNTSQSIRIKLKNKVSYKYYRLKEKTGKKYVDVADFGLFGVDNKIIRSGFFAEINDEKSVDTVKINDNNPLSFIRRRGLKVKYSFKKAIEVSGFQIQSRNDGNHIDLGDAYELFYWNKDWKSLGGQKAKDTVLVYENVPKNFLYLLKNNTKGREEFVFKLDEEGKQFWVGSSEYENIDLPFTTSKTYK